MNSLLLLLPLFSSLLAFAAASIVDFYQPRCYHSHAKGQLVKLDVTPCDSNPCHFPKGRNVTLTATFTTPTEITAAKPVVYAHLGFQTVPEPFHMEQDACAHFDTPCPLAPGVQHTYTASVFISPIYPQIRVVAEWQIRDQNDVPIVCFNVPVQVTGS